MANKGPVLATNKHLSVNDYLVSKSGLFFAIMQADGNFCVYRGSGPDNNYGLLWCTKKTARGGQFFAIMQTDGNFVIYKGKPGGKRAHLWSHKKTAPGGEFYATIQDDGNFCVYQGKRPEENRGRPVWCSKVIDEVKDVEMSKIDYDLDGKKTLNSPDQNVYQHTVHNETGVTQTSSIGGSFSVTKSSGWSNSLGVNITVKASGEVKVPVFANGKVEVSAGVTNTFTFNKSESKTETYTFNVPVSVPPHSTINCLITTTRTTIIVPYTLTGVFVLKSGARVPGSMSGLYTGEDSHDQTIKMISLKPDTLRIQIKKQALKVKKIQSDSFLARGRTKRTAVK